MRPRIFPQPFGVFNCISARNNIIMFHTRLDHLHTRRRTVRFPFGF